MNKLMNQIDDSFSMGELNIMMIDVQENQEIFMLKCLIVTKIQHEIQSVLAMSDD